MKSIVLYPIICILLLGFFSAHGQELGLNWPASQRLLLDQPAMVGFSGQRHVYLGTYQKWFGVDRAPSTFYLGAATPVGDRRIGVGGFLLRDQVGLLSQTRVSGFGAVHTAADKPHRISVGVAASVQNFQVGQGNVVDIIGAEGYRGSRLNLGLGLNYRARLGSDQSWLNVQFQVPQLMKEVVLSGSTDSLGLGLSMPGQSVIQANIQYTLASGTQLLPSLRLYRHEGKLQENIALYDVGLGLAFRDGAFRVNIGYRNALASRVYAGMGIRLGDNLDATIVLEPLGPLGVSGGADLLMSFGEVPIVEAVDVTWYEEPFWKQRIADAGLLGYYEVVTLQDPRSVYVSYSFDDNNDLPYDLAADPPLKVEDFLDELQEVIAAVKPGGGTLRQIDLTAYVKTGFSSEVEDPFSGDGTFQLGSFYQEGLYQPPTRLSPGARLSQAQLAAIKLQFLRESIGNEIPEIPSSILSGAQLNVEQNGDIPYNRQIVVRLIFEK